MNLNPNSETVVVLALPVGVAVGYLAADSDLEEVAYTRIILVGVGGIAALNGPKWNRLLFATLLGLYTGFRLFRQEREVAATTGNPNGEPIPGQGQLPSTASGDTSGTGTFSGPGTGDIGRGGRPSGNSGNRFSQQNSQTLGRPGRG